MTSESAWLGETDPPWSSEVPTVEGWYWAVRDTFNAAPTREVVEVADVGGLCAWPACDGEAMHLSNWFLWLGPLPVPKLPGGEG